MNTLQYSAVTAAAFAFACMISPVDAQAAAGGAPVPPLGIAAGHYVAEKESCDQPSEVVFYDGKRFGIMRPGVPASGGFPAEPATGPETLESLGNVGKEGRWFFLEDWSVKLKALSPTRIQLEIQDNGPPMRLCPAAQIPGEIRVK